MRTKLAQLVSLFALCVGTAFGQHTLTSISLLSPSTGYNITSNIGTVQLTPRCFYADATNDDCATSSITLTWASMDPRLTVDSSGLVTGGGLGVGVGIEITASNGSGPTGVTGHQTVFIDDTTITNLAATTGFTASHTVVLGSTVLVSVYDSTGGSRNPSDPALNHGLSEYCHWTSGNTGIATVVASGNRTGEVTATGAGTTAIGCNIAGVTTSWSVTVVSPTQTLTTYYVRPGGNDSCTGLVDVDFTSGTACAWASYTHAGSTMASGDTVVGQLGSTTTYSLGTGVSFPSGTPAHPTKIYGACFLASNCSASQYDQGNNTAVVGLGFNVYGTQNLDIEGMDTRSGADCNQGLNGLSFGCPGGTIGYNLVANQFTSNVRIGYTRVHQGIAALTGTPGPGVVWANSVVAMNYLDGVNLDDPFGALGARGDGFTSSGSYYSQNGCTEENDQAVATAVRGSGVMTITFDDTSQLRDFVQGSNIKVKGMTPSDLNGIYPVSSVVFDQQSQTITGGTITTFSGYNSNIHTATIAVSGTPGFGTGACVRISGATPSYLNNPNGCWEVFSTAANQVVLHVSEQSHPGWADATISSGGTMTTAVSFVVTAAGSSESASVVGTVNHPIPAHRCFDQAGGGFANGDAIGAGGAGFGDWSSTQDTLTDNMQDNLDMVHSRMGSVIVLRDVSTGAEGQVLKAGNSESLLVQNNYLIANCAKQLAPHPDKPPTFNQVLGFACRANNDIAINLNAYSKANFSNNTIGGAQNVMWDDVCNNFVGCDVPLPGAYFISQNNLYFPYSDTNNPTFDSNPPAIYYADNPGDGHYANALWSFNNNMAFNGRNPPSGGSGNSWNTDPKVVHSIPNISDFASEANALTFDYALTGISPAIGAGLHNAYTPATDITGATRPNPPSIGAYEFGAPSTGPIFGGNTILSGHVSIAGGP